MILSLVSRGVVSGLCLVLAKYWYDKREDKERIQAAERDRTTESASHQFTGPWASGAVISAGAGESARDGGAADIHRAAAEAVAGDPATSPGYERQTPVPGRTRETDKGRKGGKRDDDQCVEEALASRDLSTIDTVLEDISDPVLRNRLLRRLVNGHYRRRSDALHRAAFYRAALLQMEEASSILDGIEEIGEPRPHYLEAFKSMAIALDEDGSLDGAIAVCEMALSLGLQDGTKSGFEGRIDRLRHRQRRTVAVGPKKVLH